MEGLFCPGYVVSASCFPLLIPLAQTSPGPLGRMFGERVSVDLSTVGSVKAMERQARKVETEAERILRDFPEENWTLVDVACLDTG